MHLVHTCTALNLKPVNARAVPEPQGSWAGFQQQAANKGACTPLHCEPAGRATEIASHVIAAVPQSRERCHGSYLRSLPSCQTPLLPAKLCPELDIWVPQLLSREWCLFSLPRRTAALPLCSHHPSGPQASPRTLSCWGSCNVGA